MAIAAILGLSALDALVLISSLGVALSAKVELIRSGDTDVSLSKAEEAEIMDKISSQVYSFEASTAKDLAKGLSFSGEGGSDQIDVSSAIDRFYSNLYNDPDKDRCFRIKQNIRSAKNLLRFAELESPENVLKIKSTIDELYSEYNARCGESLTNDPSEDQLGDAADRRFKVEARSYNGYDWDDARMYNSLEDFYRDNGHSSIDAFQIDWVEELVRVHTL